MTSNRIWLETVWIPQHRLIIYMKYKPLCHIYLHLNTATYSRKYTRWQSINFGGLLLVVFYHILKRRTDEILYFCNIVISYFLYRIVFDSEWIFAGSRSWLYLLLINCRRWSYSACSCRSSASPPGFSPLLLLLSSQGGTSNAKHKHTHTWKQQ